MKEWLILVLYWGTIAAVIIAYFSVRKNRNRREAESGADKMNLRGAAIPILGEGGNDPMLYAHWEKREHYGRTVKITYYRYAVSFKNRVLTVAPLDVNKKTRQMFIAAPQVYSPENLGKVTVKTKTSKGGKRLEVWLGDKMGHTLQTLVIDGENLRKRYFPVNIYQHEECDAFEAFIEELSGYVASENPGVDAIMEAESNEGQGVIGAVISGIGAFFSIFYPPIGIVLCLVGIAMSVKSYVKGNRKLLPLIISGICAAVGVGMIILYLSVM